MCTTIFPQIVFPVCTTTIDISPDRLSGVYYDDLAGERQGLGNFLLPDELDELTQMKHEVYGQWRAHKWAYFAETLYEQFRKSRFLKAKFWGRKFRRETSEGCRSGSCLMRVSELQKLCERRLNLEPKTGICIIAVPEMQRVVRTFLLDNEAIVAARGGKNGGPSSSDVTSSAGGEFRLKVEEENSVRRLSGTMLPPEHRSRDAELRHASSPVSGRKVPLPSPRGQSRGSGEDRASADDPGTPVPARPPHGRVPLAEVILRGPQFAFGTPQQRQRFATSSSGTDMEEDQTCKLRSSDYVLINLDKQRDLLQADFIRGLLGLSPLLPDHVDREQEQQSRTVGGGNGFSTTSHVMPKITCGDPKSLGCRVVEDAPPSLRKNKASSGGQGDHDEHRLDPALTPAVLDEFAKLAAFRLIVPNIRGAFKIFSRTKLHANECSDSPHWFRADSGDLVSRPLLKPISELQIDLDWLDQGWGNQKGGVHIELIRFPGLVAEKFVRNELGYGPKVNRDYVDLYRSGGRGAGAGGRAGGKNVGEKGAAPSTGNGHAAISGSSSGNGPDGEDLGYDIMASMWLQYAPHQRKLLSENFSRENSDMVRSARRGDVFQFSYRVGGGGGHSLDIHSFVAGVSYVTE